MEKKEIQELITEKSGKNDKATEEEFFNVLRIVSRKDADKIYPIVYMADRIANYLFRHYSEAGLIKPYLSNLITPKIEDYQSLLKQNR